MAYEEATCAFCGKQFAIDHRQIVHFWDGRCMHRCCYWQKVLTDHLELKRWSEAYGVSTEQMEHSLQKVIWDYREEGRRETSQAGLRPKDVPKRGSKVL